MSAAKTYTALTPIEHDGKPFAEGSAIELTDEQAAQLLELKAVELRARQPKAKAATAQAEAPAAADEAKPEAQAEAQAGGEAAAAA